MSARKRTSVHALAHMHKCACAHTRTSVRARTDRHARTRKQIGEDIPNAGDTLRTRLVGIFQTPLNGLPFFLQSDHFLLQALRLVVVLQTFAFSSFAFKLGSLAFKSNRGKDIKSSNSIIS